MTRTHRCASRTKRRAADASATTDIGGYRCGRSLGTTLRNHDFTQTSSRAALSTVLPTRLVTSLLTIQTRGAGFTDLTAEVVEFVKEAHARAGAVTLFIRHTSASLTIQENADPSVLADLMMALERHRAR